MKKAFTLAEILICMMIMGILAVIMLSTLSGSHYVDKSYTASALKVIDNIEQASAKIEEMDPERCPVGKFMVNAGTSPQYALNVGQDSTSILNLYGDYIKYEASPLNFCDYSGYCTNTAIKGAKLSGNTYIGFEISSSIIDCPNYYMPGSEGQITGKGKCWGKLYIDADGPAGANTLGKDVFILGLGADGIVK